MDLIVCTNSDTFPVWFNTYTTGGSAMARRMDWVLEAEIPEAYRNGLAGTALAQAYGIEV